MTRASGPSKRPNVFLILADQHRWNALGCYGNLEVLTPHLDAMAAGGVRFTHSVSASPICAPFRATLQTGRYVHQHGVTRNNVPLDPTSKSLADYFNGAGYESCYIGKCHWYDEQRPGYVPEEERLRWRHWHGFNRGHYTFDAPTFDAEDRLTHAHRGRYEPEVHTDQALAFIDDHARTPWIVQLNWGPPHTATMDYLHARPEVAARVERLNAELGFGLQLEALEGHPESWFPQSLVGELVPDTYLEMYPRDRLTLQPNVHEELEAVTRYYYQEYYAMVTSLDDEVRRIMAHLDNRGLSDRTIVVYTSDHGDVLGSHTHPGRVAHEEQGTGVNKGRGKGVPLQNAYRTPLIVWGPGHVRSGSTTDALVNSVDLLPTLLELAGLSPDPDLPGLSQASWCLTGSGQKQADVMLGLADWRAIYDGRYFYSMKVDGGRLEPLALIDTHEDPYDLNNLLLEPRQHRGRIDDLQARLIQRMKAEADFAGL